MINLHVNNGTDTFIHDPAPSVVIRNVFRGSEEAVELWENEITWSIDGILIPRDGLISDQVIELKGFYNVGELTSVELQDDGVIIESIPTDRGIKIESLEFPEGDGPEWATKRKFSLVLKGSTIPTTLATYGEYSYNISYTTDQSGLISRTINGTLKDFKDKDAETKYEAFKTAQGWATWTDANLSSDTYSTNKDDTKCNFTIVHRKYWTAYPTGITNADYSRDTRVDGQGVTREIISGWFEGPAANCLAAINALRQPFAIVNESVSRNPYTHRTSFTLSYINSITSDIISFTEQITINASIEDFVHKRVLGGYPPVRQVVSKTPATAIQTGTIKRLAMYPEEPPSHWNAMYMKSRSITKNSPENRVSNSVYGLSYAYSFEFEVTPSW